MTEEEAKTKWCPFTRMVFGYKDGTTQPFNRFMCETGDDMDKMQSAMNGTMGTKCIASDCTIWVVDADVPGNETGHCGLIK